MWRYQPAWLLRLLDEHQVPRLLPIYCSRPRKGAKVADTAEVLATTQGADVKREKKHRHLQKTEAHFH